MLGSKSKMMWKNKMLGFAMLYRPFSLGEGEGGRGLDLTLVPSPEGEGGRAVDYFFSLCKDKSIS
jgi:hypothetical protein